MWIHVNFAKTLWIWYKSNKNYDLFNEFNKMTLKQMYNNKELRTIKTSV